MCAVRLREQEAYSESLRAQLDDVVAQRALAADRAAALSADFDDEVAKNQGLEHKVQALLQENESAIAYIRQQDDRVRTRVQCP